MTTTGVISSKDRHFWGYQTGRDAKALLISCGEHVVTGQQPNEPPGRGSDANKESDDGSLPDAAE